MTKQLTSGEEKLEGDWYGQHAEAKSDPLIDNGTGTPVVMRFFEFSANSEEFKKHNPSNQELFNAHSQQVRMMLWADGLEPFQGIEPKIIRSKKIGAYRIMITCIPKKGVVLNDTTQTLQQIIK